MLVKPMHEWAAGLNKGWTNDYYEPERSTRAQALDLLGGKDSPAFLLTASHGACRLMNSSGQREQMGALVCQDWPGKGKGKEFRDCIVAGEDIPADAKLAGLIAMTFACFGGGTPAMNEFPMEGWPAQWPEKPLLAALPKRMLSHPKGRAQLRHCSAPHESRRRQRVDQPRTADHEFPERLPQLRGHG
jgi:hypothetical protein